MYFFYRNSYIIATLNGVILSSDHLLHRLQPPDDLVVGFLGYFEVFHKLAVFFYFVR